MPRKGMRLIRPPWDAEHIAELVAAALDGVPCPIDVFLTTACGLPDVVTAWRLVQDAITAGRTNTLPPIVLEAVERLDLKAPDWTAQARTFGEVYVVTAARHYRDGDAPRQRAGALVTPAPMSAEDWEKAVRDHYAA